MAKTTEQLMKVLDEGTNSNEKRGVAIIKETQDEIQKIRAEGFDCKRFWGCNLGIKCLEENKCLGQKIQI